MNNIILYDWLSAKKKNEWKKCSPLGFTHLGCTRSDWTDAWRHGRFWACVHSETFIFIWWVEMGNVTIVKGTCNNKKWSFFLLITWQNFCICLVFILSSSWWQAIQMQYLPCGVWCAFDEFCDDNDGRYGGKLMFDSIFTDDELRLLVLPSPSDDDESFIFDDADVAFRCKNRSKQIEFETKILFFLLLAKIAFCSFFLLIRT